MWFRGLNELDGINGCHLVSGPGHHWLRIGVTPFASVQRFDFLMVWAPLGIRCNLLVKVQNMQSWERGKFSGARMWRN